MNKEEKAEMVEAIADTFIGKPACDAVECLCVALAALYEIYWRPTGFPASEFSKGLADFVEEIATNMHIGPSN
jgi:hypothetical protein